MSPLPEIGIDILLGMAFGAGGALFMIKQSKKDVNGLGRRLKQEVEKMENVRLAVMLITPEEYKRDVARVLTVREE